MEELIVTLVDASSKKQRPEPLGRCKIRLIDLDLEAHAQHGANGAQHDAWHVTSKLKGRASSAVELLGGGLGALGLGDWHLGGLKAAASSSKFDAGGAAGGGGSGAVERATDTYDEPLALRVKCASRVSSTLTRRLPSDAF